MDDKKRERDCEDYNMNDAGGVRGGVRGAVYVVLCTS
jgi:hypothetical protein